jgi:C4-dicarboxylate-specific signal transduction histidine kinase
MTWGTVLPEHEIQPEAASAEKLKRIAHELNNPLDGIQRYVRLALQLSKEGKSQEIAWYLEEAGSGLARLASMIHEIAGQSAGNVATDQMTVRDVIDEARRVHAIRARASNVSIQLDFNDVPLAPSGSELYRIASNLILNAVEAMNEGGELTIAGRAVSGEYVIQFCDTGPGLPDALEWAFVPHNTSKQDHQGLGLSICRDCATRLGGGLSAENQSPCGACFTLRLPIRSGAFLSGQ